MNKSAGRRDYRLYRFSGRELAAEAAAGAAVTVFLAWFFYRSLWAVPPLSVVGFLYVRRRKKEKQQACQAALLRQFRECILSVSASLRAGYAVENAFLESAGDMRMLFGEAAPIFKELEWIRRGLVINIPLEDLLFDLAGRSGLEEIEEFAQVFAIAKSSGGSLPEIIRSSSELIGRRVETGEEILAMLAERRLEQNIMSVMPFGIVVYIGFTYEGYFDPLYHNLMGTAIMTICLALYMAACWLAGRILNRTGEV